jgi:hypothetical protein
MLSFGINDAIVATRRNGRGSNGCNLSVVYYDVAIFNYGSVAHMNGSVRNKGFSFEVRSGINNFL